MNELDRHEKPRTVAIIQARMGSQRLPGKVLLDIAGQPMLARVYERTRLAGAVDQVVVATTDQPDDDPIAELCEGRGYACYRGSLPDVLDRYCQAARQFGAEVIVRVTADCPLIDPGVIDRTVEAFYGLTAPQDQPLSTGLPGEIQPASASPWQPAYDFAANRLPPPWGRTYPIGLDVEVCTATALEAAWREADLPYQREHVMPFFYDNLQRFRVLLVNAEANFGALRWTVDTPEDLDLLRRIYAAFPGRDDVSWLEALDLTERHPELTQINAGIAAKDYRHYDRRHF